MSDILAERYEGLFGQVPEGIRRRVELARAAGRESDIEAIEGFRKALIAENTLEPRTQQLVHFAMLLATGDMGPARLHAEGALRQGATLEDLYGVAQTAAVVCGMPGLSRATEILHPLIAREDGAPIAAETDHLRLET